MAEDKKIIIFPGNKAEYESLVGYKVEIFNNPFSQLNKGLYVNESAEIGFINTLGKKPFFGVQKLLDPDTNPMSKIEAIVNAQFITIPTPDSMTHSLYVYYGLPVKRKSKGDKQ